MIDKNRRQILGKIAAAGVAAIAVPLAMACDDKHQATEHVVEIKDSQFTPLDLKVKSGDTIIWVNLDIVPHTATAKDGTWDTGLIATNERKSIVVVAEMNPDYYCRFHPVMIAKLEIN